MALVLLPRMASDTSSAGDLIARRLLAAAALTETLHAYPVPGSQVSWSLMLAAVCGAVAVSDGVSELIATEAWQNTSRRALAVGAGVLLVVAIPLVLPAGVSGEVAVPGTQFTDWFDHYQERLPIAVPGAERVRASLGERRVFKRVISATQRSCGTFVPLGVRHTYYLLTGLRPATGLNAPSLLLLTSHESRRVVAALRSRPRVCILLSIVAGYRSPDGRVTVTAPIARREIVRFVEASQWAPVDRVFNIEILRRAQPPRSDARLRLACEPA